MNHTSTTWSSAQSAGSLAVRSAGGLRVLATIQGLYFLATGLWPLIHMESFLWVTGPKTDLWLVRTVGVLVTAVALTILTAAWRGRLTRETAVLAVGSALGLGAIDVIYAGLGVIDRIYLIDAAAEAVLIAAWGFWLRREGAR